MTQCRKIMIQGTMSGAGKSLLVTALCRIFHEDGKRVAPFKSQNMALNSYITADGLEMGRAQAAQAEACGKLPDVRMNPILLKPTSDVGSQLIVNGRVRGTYRAADYFRMKKTLIPDIMEAFRSLEAENDVIVIEGAGSPAEINLKSDDIVNMGLASMVDAPVILVGDIDPGGVFAQLYGTIMLLTAEERARIVGTVINKFRGDVDILRPGLSMLEELTRVPVLGVVPYADIDIDDEDSLSPRLAGRSHDRPIDIAVIRFPRISNFTDITPLTAHPYLGVRYVERSFPGQKTRWMISCGSVKTVLRPGSSDMPRHKARSSAYAEAFRCWANRCPTLREATAAERAAGCGGWDFCRLSRSSALKRHGVRSRVACVPANWRVPLSAATRYIWGRRGSRMERILLRGCAVKMSQIFSNRYAVNLRPVISRSPAIIPTHLINHTETVRRSPDRRRTAVYVATFSARIFTGSLTRES